jgi:hypothetical protein
MATLSGTKVKDQFGNLLQVNGGVDGTLSTVEDGNGNTSALKLSSTEVQLPSAGTKLTGTPPNAASELTMLMVNSSNQMVTREFDFTMSDNISVDTGWQDMHVNADDGGTFYGIKNDLSSTLAVRYVGREVKLKGELYIPLDKVGSGTDTLATSVAENKTHDKTKLFTASGWTGASYKITTPVIFSSDVAASFDDNMVEQQLTPFVPVSRTVFLTSASASTVTYTTFVSVFINSSLQLEIRSRLYDTNGDHAHVSPVEEILMNFTTAHNFVDYTDYLNTLNQDTKTNASHAPNFDFNGRGESDMANWGGLKLKLDGLSFMLDSTVGLEIIQSAGV